MMKPLNRKTVLRGSGIAMALPWLEIMGESSAKAPLRFLSVFQPNGVFPKAWDIKEAGENFNFSTILKPFERHRKDVNILSNIDNVSVSGHVEMTSSFLNGVSAGKVSEGSDGVSLDQKIARVIGNDTLFPSIQLGTEPPRQGKAGNLPIAYANTVSWVSPFTRLSPEINPRQAFDRLFASRTDKNYAQKMKSQESILDLVMHDAKALIKNASYRDQHKIDEYFESVRSAEKKIKHNINPPKKAWEPKVKPHFNRPESGLPRNKLDHLRSMIDIMVLALQTDSTRVGTLMTAHGFSRQNFSFLEGVKNDHHGMSHHKNAKREVFEYTKVSTWYAEQMAYMMDQLSAINEGENSLLDNTVLLYGSGMKDGNGHVRKNLPLVLAGGGKHIKTGLHTVCEESTPLSNLHLTLMRKFGIEADSFNGASKGDLDHLI